jgi:hypothetical protein
MPPSDSDSDEDEDEDTKKAKAKAKKKAAAADGGGPSSGAGAAAGAPKLTRKEEKAMAADMERLALVRQRRCVLLVFSVMWERRRVCAPSKQHASTLTPLSQPPSIPSHPIPSEAERQARIKEEGWDRFAPVSETNKPPAGAPLAKPKPPSEDEDDDSGSD